MNFSPIELPPLSLRPCGAAVDGDAGDAVAVGGGFAVVLVLAAVAGVGPLAVAVVPPGRPVAEAFFRRGQRVVRLSKEQEGSCKRMSGGILNI